ncbi:exopolysaccharide Pel transporter PelG [Marinobacterium jannaschii]|uniref:exopolysaccharide Pel transporter PelG n=1 Tax=Marinobacterium jannaschii TaxID=64970 RepID=UPI0004858D98|nr:exopolysaccharide Pel transporter PelG [Marinobacterium jannaschii]
MAGIGFEIRKLLKKNTLLSFIEAYGYAGIISSGPWVLSILSLMLTGLLISGSTASSATTVSFLVSVTYLMAGSLVLSGGIQLMLIRYISDRIYDQDHEQILPNLMGACLLTSLLAGLVGTMLTPLFAGQSLLVKVTLVASFVALCNIWLMTIFLSGIKEYKLIFRTMFVAYSALVGAALLLKQYGLEGLFLAFFFGQFLLMTLFLYIIVRRFPARQLVSFDLLKPTRVYYSLFWCGLFYNLAIWADKFIFWYTDSTSAQIIGPFRASVIYDLPIFIAYLSIIPGMAVFLVRLETDFAEKYHNFYDAIRLGSTLDEIEAYKDQMVASIHRGIMEIYKVQGVTVVLMFLWSEQILLSLGLDTGYVSLLRIDLIGVGMQVLLLALLNVLFYLDKRREAVGLCGLFLLLNTSLTLLSIELGPLFYGYGFSCAVMITSVVGLVQLRYLLDKHEYITFMLQR